MHPRHSVDGYRSLPHKGPFLVATLLAMLQYFALIAMITLGIILTIAGGTKLTAGFIGAAIASAIFWLAGFFRRSTAKCPLCKGTPLWDTAASKHRDAVRYRPLTHGSSALVSLLMSQRFRCMYCGTGFDLLRKSSRNH